MRKLLVLVLLLALLLVAPLTAVAQSGGGATFNTGSGYNLGGTVIGKALGELEEGTGVIEILVILQ